LTCQTSSLSCSKNRRPGRTKTSIFQSRSFKKTRPPKRNLRPSKSVSLSQKKKQKFRSLENSKKELTIDKVKSMPSVLNVPLSKTNVTTEPRNAMPKRNADASSRNSKPLAESNSKIRKTDLLPRQNANAMNS
jgi:hypothetical protein